MLAAVVADLGRMVTERRGPALSDEPDAVHQLRTSVRRMRNVLAAFEPCFEREPAEKFAVVLAAYGGLLGECRDLEVRASDASAVLEDLAQGDLYDAVVAPLLADHDRAHAALVAWHLAGGAASLDVLLAHWSVDAPLTDRAHRPATTIAAKAVRRQVRRVLDRADRLGGDDVAEAEEAVHALRRAARRLRHTADAVEGVDGLDGTAVVGGLGQRIQGLLGDHRDAMLLADHVRDCAAGTVAGMADRTSYDRVVGRAQTLADEAMAGLDGALADLRGVAVP